MPTTYVTTEIICGRRGWYSLRAYLGKEEYKLYKDLTEDIEKLKALSIRINGGKVSVLHIDDIIEDFLD